MSVYANHTLFNQSNTQYPFIENAIKFQLETYHLFLYHRIISKLSLNSTASIEPIYFQQYRKKKTEILLEELNIFITELQVLKVQSRTHLQIKYQFFQGLFLHHIFDKYIPSSTTSFTFFRPPYPFLLSTFNDNNLTSILLSFVLRPQASLEICLAKLHSLLLAN